MRTQGTFQDVYTAVRDFYNGDDEGQPHDPVVRKEENQWMLESGLNSAENADFECSLEAFDSWFYETYCLAGYMPGGEEETDLVERMR